VLRIKYKGFSPERPLSNVFTSYRSIFTPIQKVSVALYDLSWDSQARPQAVFISFIKYVTYVTPTSTRFPLDLNLKILFVRAGSVTVR
jgi:hypothetical protein